MRALSVSQVADYVEVSESFLNKGPVYGGGPFFIKVGRRVVYERADLDLWLDPKVASTSQTWRRG